MATKKLTGDLVFGPLTVVGHSDIGDRSGQEDFTAVVRRRDGSVLALVADGMGGVQFGAEAAYAGVTAFGDAFIKARTNASVSDVFASCFAIAQQAATRAGGGAALTVAWTHPNRQSADIAWCGDVGAFRVSRAGVRATVEPHRPPWHSNALTRCIGLPGKGDYERANWPFVDDRAIVLATDGAWDVPGLNMAAVCSVAPKDRARFLVELALGLGVGRKSRDNASAIVISRASSS